MSTTKRNLSTGRQVPKIIGYSLGICVAFIFLLIFFWVLISIYDITLIVDSDTHIIFQKFFNLLYFVFIIILGFAGFAPVMHFAFEGICSFRNKKKKTGMLYLITKNKEKIVYFGIIGYWFLYIVGMSLYIMFFLIK